MTTELAEQSTGPPRVAVLERGAAMTSAATEYMRTGPLLSRADAVAVRAQAPRSGTAQSTVTADSHRPGS
jgi:hypothetical protein